MDVVCALIEKNQQVLLARRPLSKDFGGFWEFPGGKVQWGESHEQALQRELFEELKIEAYDFKPVGSICENSSSLTLHALLCKHRGYLIPIEHSALSWVHPAQLERYKLCPNDRELLKAHQSSLPSWWINKS